MSYCLHENLKKLDPYISPTGTYDVYLNANESCFNPGERFREELQDALAETPLNRYPDPDCKKLREAFGAAYNVDPSLVVAGNGSDELLGILMGAFLQYGQTLLTLDPDFSMYRVYAETYGKQVVTMKKENDRIDVDAVLERLNGANGPDLLIFSNPCNPLPTALERQDVIRLIEGTEKMVVVDEAYTDFCPELSVLDLAGQYANLIVLKTCSKAWGGAGLRLGFAVATPEVAGVLNAIRSPYNVNVLTQAAGCVVLRHTEELKRAAAAMREAAERIYKELYPLQLCGKVEQVCETKTNFVFVKTAQAEALYEGLKKRSILIRRTGGHLRITAGTEEENERLIAAFYDLLEEERKSI